MVAALILGQSSETLRPGWHPCVVDPEQLKAKAEMALEGWKEQPIVVTSMESRHVLWMREEEDSTWLFLGVMDYGSPPSGQRLPVRWLRISHPEVQTQGILQRPAIAIDSDETSSEIEEILREAASWTGEIADVDCLVTVDEKERVFAVLFERKSDGRRIASRTTNRTDELLHLLRYPLTEGGFPEAEDGTLMRWNYLSDVRYDDVFLKGKTREWLSLSLLKPLVHSPRFLSGCYPVPETCEGLLRTRLGDDITLVVDIDEKNRQAGSKSFLRARVIDVSESSGLRRLESMFLRPFDIALLAECEQIVDT
jgi:hypothetical protein